MQFDLTGIGTRRLHLEAKIADRVMTSCAGEAGAPYRAGLGCGKRHRHRALECPDTSGGGMKEPLYRWVCTMCGISDQAESPELARLNIDLHVRLAHPDERETVPVPDEEDGGLRA